MRNLKLPQAVIRLVLITVLLLIIAFGIWKTTNHKESSILTNKQLELPKAAKYFSNDAYLTIHFYFNPNKIPKYFESSANNKKRNVPYKNGIKIRDGLFDLTSLDFNTDLSDWISSNFSFTISNSYGKTNSQNWILALEARSNEEAKTFLNRYWGDKSSNKADIKRDMYQSQEVIYTESLSTKGKNGNIAMTLGEDSIVLISSNKEMLIQAIKISKDSKANQLNNIQLKNSIKDLDQGLALIHASNKALNSFIKTPEYSYEDMTYNGFVGSINLKGKDIFLDGFCILKDKITASEYQINSGYELIGNEINGALEISILSEDRKVISRDSTDIYSLYIKGLLEEIINEFDSNVAKQIIELGKGPLVLIKKKDGWIIESDDYGQVQKIETIIEERGFNKSVLHVKDKDIIVWSKLITKEINSDYKLIPDIGVILFEEQNKLIWTNSISSIDSFYQEDSSYPDKNELLKINVSDNKNFHQQLYLRENSAEKFLANWGPFQLLKTISSGPSKPKIKSLNLALGTKDENQESKLNFKAMLSIN
ncbi:MULTISPECIES: DUF3352 domain-containing protein [unclassified Prochlorococcus]|uniref:DUF3352 domain-containing protein n=1 Tax=unclassified Prochlorococcus TaxID=2627481 RepID=UPI000533A916|nr:MULTISPECIES: DUF3352 domain-containing protein [unclassified Prochlorococcus]KGG16776.1 hypothetical protein EV06_0618 [Prochlorococcus sp. MIT 0602]KGG18250.1 hypothetical protein EV07_0166 [Prochlorococcus sp. MIT 0603]